MPKTEPPNADQQRKKRNLALALMIVAFVVVVYGVTILRMSGAASG